jgi:arylsulfatase A-like enzyme
MTEAGRWLERHHGSSRSFLLYVDTFDPHEPWDAPRWYVEMYDPDFTGEAVDYPLYRRSDYLSPEELRHVRALYAAEVTMVDRWVGHLLDRLEDTGHADDTVVVFTTDHGFLHGEHGYVGKSLIDADSLSAASSGDGGYATIGNLPLWEEIAHIPLVVRVPGGPRGRTPALVQPPDLMPTILDLAGHEISDTVQGRSFAPLLRGDDDRGRDVGLSFPSLVTGGLGAARITATTDRWSYVCGATANDELFLEKALEVAGGEFARDLMTSRAVDGIEKMIRRVMEPAPDELYDLKTDPHQEHDVVDEHPDLARELRSEIVERLRALGTADHILACWKTPPA